MAATSRSVVTPRTGSDTGSGERPVAYGLPVRGNLVPHTAQNAEPAACVVPQALQVVVSDITCLLAS